MAPRLAATQRQEEGVLFRRPQGVPFVRRLTLLVFNYESGAVTACFKKCLPIGTTEPAKLGEIDIKVAEAADAYLVNTVNGHVFKCDIEKDGFAENFKRGACKPLGAAASRATPDAQGDVSPEKPAQSSEANVDGSSSSANGTN
jgi:hypothetical protein